MLPGALNTRGWIWKAKLCPNGGPKNTSKWHSGTFRRWPQGALAPGIVPASVPRDISSGYLSRRFYSPRMDFLPRKRAVSNAGVRLPAARWEPTSQPKLARPARGDGALPPTLHAGCKYCVFPQVAAATPVMKTGPTGRTCHSQPVFTTVCTGRTNGMFLAPKSAPVSWRNSPERRRTVRPPPWAFRIEANHAKGVST